MSNQVIATIQKNAREEIRVSLSEFNGHDLANIRVWFRDAAPVAKWRGSAYCRTRNGLVSNIVERAGAVADTAMRIIEQLPEWHRQGGER